MQRTMCKSKLHGARITDAQLEYTGSITIDEELLEAADMLPYERVQVVNLNNGVRFETYVIEEEADSGIVCLKGPAARLGYVGDEIIVISYAMVSEDEARELEPTVVFVDEKNRPLQEGES